MREPNPGNGVVPDQVLGEAQPFCGVLGWLCWSV